ncbi:MAG TPA: FAD-dependent oxidoreductase [Anaerolineae bacterium]|nr:FAD-dependent oxidoreductase [Anaerolineae bacterium]
MTHTYDALVVGAGYIGCAVAYHLTAAGLKTALLEQGSGVAAGASRANYGNVQVQDAELEHSLPLVTAGYRRFADLEERLGAPVGYRRLGSLLLIENEAQWALMAARLPRLHAAGIAAELVPAEDLPRLEPLLDPRAFLGACYHPAEGQVWPFALLRAYLREARRLGLTVRTDTTVTGVERHGGRVTGVQTQHDSLSAPVVILTTGAWTARLGQTLGRRWPVHHVHGQALVTEPTEQRLNTHLASAAFFEAAHEAGELDQAPAVLAISQTAEGHWLLGEAARVTTEFGTGATASGQAAIARLADRHFPGLSRRRVLRGWAAPVAFTADGLPLLGPVKDIPGLILATAFKSTVIITPLVGELVAQYVVNGQTELDWQPFSPDRGGP